MGLLWSKPSQDFEKILSDLTSRIVKVEQTVGECRKRQRSWSLWILSYGSLLYVLYVLWVFVYPRGPSTVPYRPLLDAIGLITGPFVIYSLRKFLSWLYRRRIAYYDSKLGEYRSQQKSKVEELKKITSYYKKNGILYKYDLQDDSNANKNAALSKLEREKSRKHTSLPSTSIPPEGLQAYPMNGDAPTTQTGTKEIMPFGSNNESSLVPSSYAPSLPLAPTPPTWLDRLVDAILGDDRYARYALICQKCLSHNGLARPEDFDSTKYICPNCHHLNLPRKSKLFDSSISKDEFDDFGKFHEDKETKLGSSASTSSSSFGSLAVESDSLSASALSIPTDQSPSTPIASHSKITTPLETVTPDNKAKRRPLRKKGTKN